MRVFNREITRKAVEAKLAVIVSNYYNKAYTEQYRTKPKKPGSQFIKNNLRQLNKEWRTTIMFHANCN